MIRISYLLFFLLLIAACKEGREENKNPSSPRIKKNTSVTAPLQNQEFVRGDEIDVAVATTETFPLDSITVMVNDSVISYSGSNFTLHLPTRKVGTWRLVIKAYSRGESETHYRKVVVLPENSPEALTYTVENAYPHNTEDYTQGLLIRDGFLYESTGQRGSSTFKKKNLTSGETLKTVNLDSEFFGEGLATLNEEFFQLTWTSGKGFVYDSDMNQIRTFSYQTEGWGLTSLDGMLVMSDGTEKLYFMEPAGFTVQQELEVYNNQGKVENLNEMEVIDGLIYANVYQEDLIVVIDPKTGEVLREITLTGLLSEVEAKEADVLNGIAYDEKTGKIYVTGKWWPKLFEVTFKPKPI